MSVCKSVCVFISDVGVNETRYESDLVYTRKHRAINVVNKILDPTHNVYQIVVGK